ncbi:MAG: Kelch repeat-containing protein [Bacilli bacterium]
MKTRRVTTVVAMATAFLVATVLLFMRMETVIPGRTVNIAAGAFAAADREFTAPRTGGSPDERAPAALRGSRNGVHTAAAWPYVRFAVVRNVLPQGLVGVSLSIGGRKGIFAAGGYNGLQSVSDVREVFPQQRLFARLTVPTHDAASCWIGSNLYVFGGGQALSYNTIVRIQPSLATVVDHLPTALSDAGMVPYAGGALLVGGHNGNTFSKEALLYTHQGPVLRARVLFRLPTGLRYAGLASMGKRLWIAGGRTAAGMSREIYYFAPGLAEARAVGRLPVAIDKAAAWAVPGYVLIAGGQTLQGVPQKNVYAFNMVTRQVRVVGTLPTPLADMGYVSNSRGTYLVGGATAANLSTLSRNLVVIYTTWFR